MPEGDRRQSKPRIAIAFQGDPSDPSSWSGIPAGLESGLSAAGADTLPINVRFPGAPKLANRLRMSWAEVASNRFFFAASTATANRRVRQARVDGVVTIGSGFALSTEFRAITFEDMTVVQALRYEGRTLQSLGEGAAKRWRARQGLIYERSHACCVTSSWVAGSVRDDYGIPSERIHLVGLGRNLEPSQNPGKDWSEPHFIFAGFDWERKRGSAVVEAFTQLRRRQPQATLDLVGDHPRVEAAGVTGHGPLNLSSESEQRRYADLLSRATCFVMPSSYEPFGIAYVDAGAAGVPSIGTTVGGAVDAVGPGGVLVDPGDDCALLEAMLALSVPTTARRLGELARERSALFTWHAVGQRLLQALGASENPLPASISHDPGGWRSQPECPSSLDPRN